MKNLLKIDNWKLKIAFFALILFLLVAKNADAATISRPTQSLGLVGYWSFDVGKGGAKAVDMSGRGNNGTLTNMNTTAAWVGGKIGNALNFDGVDDYVKAGAGEAITGDMTASAWVKTPSAISTDYPQIISRAGDGDTTNGWNLYWYRLGGANKFSFIVKVGAGAWGDDYAQTADGFASPSTWYFVTGVRRGTTMEIWVNGKLEATDAGTSGTITYSASPTYQIGTKASGDVTTMWKGTIDEVRVYNRALSAAEIYRLYNMAR